MLPSNLRPIKLIYQISWCYGIALILSPPLTFSFSPLFRSANPRVILSSQHRRLKEQLCIHSDFSNSEWLIGRRQAMMLYSSSGVNRRKRRRRKDTSEGDNGDGATDGGAELPDFDINEDDGSESLTSVGASSVYPSPSAVDPLSGPITPNMMGDSRSSASSVKDLLRDRSLEQKLERLYGEEGNDQNESLPDLISLQKQKSNSPSGDNTNVSTLSKRERQMLARQQQDEEQKKLQQNAAKEEDLSDLFSKLPFVTNEKGKVEPIKILETATWACIIALVLWEVYINSPFFTRAAPIIPVVYDFWI